MEHCTCSMIWNSIQGAKVKKQDLSFIWLDLANAFGSVRHRLIKFAMDILHIPAKIQRMLMSYYDNFKMMLIFRLAYPWAVQCRMFSWGCRQGYRNSSRSNHVWDEIVYGWFNPVKLQHQVSILQRLWALIEWARMVFKAKKSRS